VHSPESIYCSHPLLPVVESRDIFFGGMPTRKVPKDLIVLLRALASYTLTIETRSGTLIHGVLESVDTNMNVTMSQVTIDAGSETFPSLFLSGRHIVFVHLPEHMDIREQIDSYEQRNRR
jgi:small nuclear ribonucleoprotein (snRNP)-like protein